VNDVSLLSLSHYVNRKLPGQSDIVTLKADYVSALSSIADRLDRSANYGCCRWGCALIALHCAGYSGKFKQAHHLTPHTSRKSASPPPQVAPLQGLKIMTSPSEEAVESARLLYQLVGMSKRTSGIQLPVGFVRAPRLAARPLLARMLRDGDSDRGGRGGAVRLKLYLCLNLLAAHPPYDIRSVPARAWATALALPDPERNGARRVNDAIDWLNEAKAIGLRRHRGSAPTLTLLDPAGGGGRYRRSSPYVRVPLGFWREQWITRLSGSAVALLIVLLDLQGGKKSKRDAPWLTTRQRDRYGLSDDTWTRASKELAKNGLLEIGRVSQGRDFDYRRMRNTYWIDHGRLDQPDLDYPLNSLVFLLPEGQKPGVAV
jgi:hypothetical protein